jgi:hypothetical protein
MTFKSSVQHLQRTARRYIPGPPRSLNEARINTVDRKICSLKWDGRNQIDITLQDRASAVTFPLNLRRDAGKFLSCFRDGGMISLRPSSDSMTELRVGSDKGMLYFSLKGDDTTITTGLNSGEAVLASSLIRFAEQKRLERALL